MQGITWESLKELLLAEYSLGQWGLVFFLYSFAGWCWEVSLYLVRQKRFINRGFLTGPILPIYGFGAVSILGVCVPFKDDVLMVALVGMTVASALEYVTGVLMEALFHVRYWDYSNRPFNLNGHICLMSAATWAFFSVIIVCVVQPYMRPVILRVPQTVAGAASGTLAFFAAVDTVFAVRKGLDLRALLVSMERYAKELEALHGGLDSVSDRVGEMIRSFAEHVDMKQEEMLAGAQRITAARDRVAKMMQERTLTLADGAKVRFENFERILSEAASYLPDTESLIREVEAIREQYDQQTEKLREVRRKKLAHTQRVLRSNPTAASRKHSRALALLRRHEEEMDDPEEDKTA
ncbi:MAG: hypothetical protein Q4G52_07840 [Clostridia bacterium]|nr:hypothetical protein [Clostridia bacterium]